MKTNPSKPIESKCSECVHFDQSSGYCHKKDIKRTCDSPACHDYKKQPDEEDLWPLI